jgi:hypothetical protein
MDCRFRSVLTHVSRHREFSLSVSEHEHRFVFF